MSQLPPTPTKTGLIIQLPPEPQSIGLFLAKGHPWMALTVTLTWLAPLGLAALSIVAMSLQLLQ